MENRKNDALFESWKKTQVSEAASGACVIFLSEISTDDEREREREDSLESYTHLSKMWNSSEKDSSCALRHSTQFRLHTSTEKNSEQREREQNHKATGQRKHSHSLRIACTNSRSPELGLLLLFDPQR